MLHRMRIRNIICLSWSPFYYLLFYASSMLYPRFLIFSHPIFDSTAVRLTESIVAVSVKVGVLFPRVRRQVCTVRMIWWICRLESKMGYRNNIGNRRGKYNKTSTSRDLPASINHSISSINRLAVPLLRLSCLRLHYYPILITLHCQAWPALPIEIIRHE